MVMRELAFGGQPVIDIMAIVPPPRLEDVVREASDLVARRAIASACVFGHCSFAREGRCDIGEGHNSLLAFLQLRLR